MADILFKCSQCGKHLVIGDSAAGLTINCSDCHAPVHVPQLHTPPHRSFDPHGNPIFTHPEASPITCPHCNVTFFAARQLLRETIHCPNCRSDIAPTADHPGVKALEAGLQHAEDLRQIEDTVRSDQLQHDAHISPPSASRNRSRIAWRLLRWCAGLSLLIVLLVIAYGLYTRK
ncbi:MAG TPA: hypothetical protein VMP11_05825 [Verrucomicrobiae bacterium]|nr:hypothetical protein [Verrucomicrobiae bacterium]